MADLFPRVGAFRLGYHRAEVDEYFSQARVAYEQLQPGADLAAFDVRRVNFDLTRRGYSTAAVDAALDRLETAFATRSKERYVARYGQDAWMRDLADRAQTLYPRLRRPAGERFARPRRMRGGYDARQVDRLMDRLVAFFDTGAPLTADDIRAAAFKRRSGRGGYDERVVDVYLARAIDILLGVS